MDIQNLVSFCGIFLMAGFAWLISTDRHIVNWRLIAWGIGLQLLFGLGIGMVLSVLHVFLRDTAQIVSVGLNVLFWLTPVIYVEEILPAWLRSLEPFNPIYLFSKTHQQLLLHGTLPSATRTLGLVVLTGVTLAIGTAVYRRFRADILDEQERWQARANVLIEAGMALAIDQQRTILLTLGRSTLPSDLSGRTFIRLTNSPEARTRLRNALETVGCKLGRVTADWLNPGLSGDFETATAALPEVGASVIFRNGE